MAMAIGQKQKGRTALEESDNDGAFKRRDSVYRHIVRKGDQFEPAGATVAGAWAVCRLHYRSKAACYGDQTMRLLLYPALGCGASPEAVCHARNTSCSL